MIFLPKEPAIGLLIQFSNRMVRSISFYRSIIGDKNEFLKFILVFSVSVFAVYFLPDIVSKLLFGILLFLFYRSKKNYFWFAFIYFCVDAPSGLFPNGDLNYGMPMVTLPFIITFQELFIYVAFVKALRIKKTYFLYSKPVQILIIYMVFLFLITFLLGTSQRSILESIKWTLSWSLLYSVPRLISSEEDWISFFRLLFPITFIALGTQIFQLILDTNMLLLLLYNILAI